MKIGKSNIDFDGSLIESPNGLSRVEPKIMDLLRVLADNPGQVMSRDDLISAVWGVEFGGDERLSRAISILRKALGDNKKPHTYIKTIPRKGYRLVAELSTATQQIAQKIDAIETAKSIAPETPVETTTPKPALPKNVSENLPQFKPRKKIWLLALSIFAIAIAAVWTVSPDIGNLSPVNTRLDAGYVNIEKFTKDGAIQDAQDIFKNVLANDPDHSAARAGLALSLMREYTHLERDPATLQRAKSHAEAALRSDEHLAIANIAVGWAIEYEGQYERALEFLDRADILDPDNKLSIESRARIYRKSNRIEDSNQTLNSGISIHPDYAIFHLDLAENYVSQDRFEDAEHTFKRGIDLATDNPRAYAQLAHALHMQDKTSAAIKVIQKGLAVNESSLLYSNLGAYLFFQGQYETAASAFEKTLKLEGDSHNYLYWANLADSYRWTAGRKKDAETAYRRAIQLLQESRGRNPNNRNLDTREALYFAKLGNLDASRTILMQVDFNANMTSSQLYRTVVIYEIMSERDRALILLGRTIDAGYPLTEIKNDPELARLRQDPGYHKLLAR